MSYRQPNPKLRAHDDLNPRDREHYEVARLCRGWFTPGEFRDRYSIMYPSRKTTCIIPSDYCFNRENKGNSMYPRFLEWDNARKYRFVGMHGRDESM